MRTLLLTRAVHACNTCNMRSYLTLMYVGDGFMKKALGTRDPCVMFVLFIMAANLLLVPISWILDM